MKKIKMLKDTPVSTTGLNSLLWVKDEVYDATDDLAEALCKAKLAKLITESVGYEVDILEDDVELDSSSEDEDEDEDETDLDFFSDHN